MLALESVKNLHITMEIQKTQKSPFVKKKKPLCFSLTMRGKESQAPPSIILY